MTRTRAVWIQLDIVRIIMVVYFVLVFLGLLSAFCMLNNGILMYVIARNKKFRTATHTVIFGLSLSDFMVGCFVIPLTGVAYVTQFTPMSCMTLSCLALILTAVSTVHLILVTVERYVAIAHPFRHIEYFTARKMIVASICCWILCINGGMLPLYGWNKLDQYVARTDGYVYGEYYELLCFFGTLSRSFELIIFLAFLPAFMLIIFIVYILIFRIIRRHQNQIVATELSSNMKTEHKSSFLIAILVGYFAFSWLAQMIYVSVGNLYKDYTIISPWVLYIGNILGMSNSVLNPVLYGVGHSGIRQAIKAMFTRKRNSMEEINY